MVISFFSSFFKKHPQGFLPIFLMQLLFNFGFYGLKSLFVLYILDQYAFKEKEAFEIFAALMALSYATTLLGGFLADKFIGAKNALFIGGVLSVVGLGLFAFPSKDIAFLGIAFLGLGAGCLKPTFSTLLSFLFKDPQDLRKDAAFTDLYIAMNVGGFMGPIFCSVTSQYYGWLSGLAIVGLSFIMGMMLCFKVKSRSISLQTTHRVFYPVFVAAILTVAIVAIYYLFKYLTYFHGLMGGIVLVSIVCFGGVLYKSNPEERTGLLKTIPYILLFAFFCSLFEQAGSSIMLFFDRAVDREIMGFTLPSSTLLSLNPILILFLGTFVPALSTRYLEKKRPLEGLTKFAIGFFFISLSFGLLALATSQSQSLVSLHWILAALLLQAMGELFIIPVGFANISKLAPSRYLGLMMSIWLMAIAYGHYFAGMLAQLLPISATTTLESSLEGYTRFFFMLGSLPLSVALLLILNTLRTILPKSTANLRKVS